MTQASELQIVQGIQTIIKALAEFADADVTLNDWDVLDQPIENAPYVILATADEFSSRMDTAVEQTEYKVPLTLYEPFTDWETTLNNLRTRRSAILATFNAATSARSCGGLEGVSVNVIRSDGPIRPYYLVYTPAEQIPEATPVYLYQSIIFEVEVY